jgi:hypothetical protein
MTNRDLVNATGLARWIVANGYRQHMTRKMVLRLADTDPDLPTSVPSAGCETVWSLSQARCYSLPGRGGWNRDGAPRGGERLRPDRDPTDGAVADQA